ncbi:YfcE family phosphodiesterase [Halorubellus sp. JP-L1]|uniref:YfcE family phosphodiesterase n=1 Tax=Halorubellus sp. JP-L1 TaxID=2715753 RepID=UPI00140DA7C5|nr:YfcE family phosphodiesterase [Halorubellus sp. JP-L1]NHN41953.1 YfcE family phosphodiesterase [Halorubellus sp. JP-L1]
MRLVIFGDTHVPSRASEIPEWVLDAVREADHVVHTGDFDSQEAYETVTDAAPSLTAVAGNMDPRNLDVSVVEPFEREGVRFVVTHGTGPVESYRERVLDVGREEDADVVVAGHTHEVVDEVVDGIRLLNPGSATGAAPATRTTLYEVEVVDGDLDVTLRAE